jgi:asparagine N-glycosylation enzyme membrane subunit Stt3
MYLLVNDIYTWYGIFPIWNIITGYILLASIRAANIEEEVISDENVKFGQLLLSTIISTALFLICYYGFNLTWAATFSICIASVSGFSNSVNSLFFRDELKIKKV